MVIAFVGSGGVAGGNSFTMDIGTAGTNRLVTVAVAVESLTNLVTNVTVDGKSCTVVHAVINTSSLGMVGGFWYINESGLGSSSGSVTITAVGATSAYGVSGVLHTGVAQESPYHSGFNNTAAGTDVIRVFSINATAGGLVAGLYAIGRDGKAIAVMSSPLVDRAQFDPDASDMHQVSGVSPTTLTKEYYCYFATADIHRGVGIIVTWQEAVAAPPGSQTHQMIV